MAAIIFLFSCSDENTVPREYPRISLPEITNITPAGATFVAEVTSAGNVPISQHGFVWGFSRTLNEDYGERIYLGSFSGKGTFQADINSTLESLRSYYVSAFIKAGDYTVYSEPVQFASLGSQAPVITGFSPLSAAWGDTILIHGKNFSWKTGSNVVTFGPATPYNIFSITDTLLKCTLPEGLTTKRNAVSVSIAGNKATVKNDSLSLIYPEFTDFHPKSATWGDTIYIEGKLIGRYVKLSRSRGVYLDGIRADIFPASDSLFKITVPNTLPAESTPISIKTYDLTYTSGTNFTLMPPVITGLSTKTSTWGAILTLFGRFNVLKTMNAVTIGGLSATITSNSTTWIQVIIPSTLTTAKNQVVLKSGPFKVASTDSLTLQAPEIKYFTPASGISGTQVKIGGKYFKSGLTTVKFGTSDATINSINDSVLTCLVPNVAAGNYRINVKVISSNITSSSDFIVTNPVITSLSPTSVSYGDVVTVTGKNFTSGLSWTLGSNIISPTIVSPTQATFTIPYTLAYTPLQVKVSVSFSGITSTNTSSEYISLKDFSVTSVSPLTGKGGTVLTLSGTNLNPGSLIVKFGSTTASLSNITGAGATVTVPGLSDGESTITVSSAGKTITYPDKFTVSGSPWKRLTNLPFLYTGSGCTFDFGDRVLISTSGSSSTERVVYEFDNNTLGFNQIPGSFQSSITIPYTAILKGKGYVLGSTNDRKVALEVFNPDSLTWRRLKDFPGDWVTTPVFLADDSVLYAGPGAYREWNSTNFFRDFWKYSPTTNRWTRLRDFISVTESTNCMFIENKIVLYDGYLREYQPSSNSWITLSHQSLGKTYADRVSLVLNNLWYIGFGGDNSLFKYDPVTDSATEILYAAPFKRSRALAFSSGGYLFIGGDPATSSYDFWMYDPSKE